MTMPITKLVFSSLILLYSLLVIGSHAQTNITLGSTLTAGPNSSNWLSPSGDFAFGFYALANGLFLLGIWFDKIPDRTLVWSANRDTPAPAGSTVSLTAAGFLELAQPNGTINQIYKGPGAAKSASFLDEGNFVLKNSASKVVWQSFDSPTDTVLPGQTLVLGRKLYSNANGTVDFSIGRFMLEIQDDHNVVLSAFRYMEKAYWFTNTKDLQNVSLVFNQSTALMYLVKLTAPIYSMTLAGNLQSPIGNYYHRATIEDTGNFQQFIYPKVNGTRWTSVWSAVTEPCFVNGICGVYGFCTSPDNQTASCTCLPGYSPVDPNVPSKGCYPNVPPQQCSKTSSEIEYEIRVIDDADFANDLFADMAWIPSGDSENCRKALMDDCFCMAAVVNSSTCVKKKIPFMNARRSNSTIGYKAMIKVPIITNQTGEVRNNHRSRVIAKIGFFTSIALAVFFAAIAIYYHPTVGRHGLRKPLLSPNEADINLRAFTFQEVYEATDGFSNKLGEGAEAEVYSGTIISEDEQVEIAVKKIEKETEQNDKKFLTEVRVIGRTHHKNLVKLLGYCNEESHRILVYELIKNGPLSGFLFGEGEKPNWDSRANIVLGIAKGLSYLHDGCETQIIHCDIKPQNVLLDHRNTAKIADFGVAKLLMNGQTRTGTNIRGTAGYMAPEWIKDAPITAKVDVFSFGVMLLEIICCRRHTELKQIEEETEEEQDESILIDWVLNCVRLGKLEMVVKHDPEVLNDFVRFKRMVMVGLWCVHPDPLLRYPMKKVVQMLEGTIEVSVPPLVNPQSLEIHLQ